MTTQIGEKNNFHITPTVAHAASYTHRRSQGGLGAMHPPKFLEDILILCFERQYPKQNSVIPLNSNICPPPTFLAPKNFWAGYATAYTHQ